jgi:hypothetical protein
MNEEKKQKYKEKYQEKYQEAANWAETRDAWTRKRFDYQERWHGWRSPVGLGIGFFLSSAAVFLLSLAWVNFLA